MDDTQIVGLIGQGGAFAMLMLVLWKIGLAIVAALKDLRTAVDEHTKKDLAAQAEVREEIVAMSTRIDVIADITPIRKPQRADTGGGYYPPRKPPREDG